MKSWWRFVFSGLVMIRLTSFLPQTLGTEAKMSKLESAMDTLIDVFQYYSSKDGNKFQLSRIELRNLLRGELSGYLEVLTPQS